MASNEKLINWALSHCEVLNLKVFHYNWTTASLPSYTDIGVAVTLGGAEFLGRGTARNERLSFIKAFAEALERAVAFGCGLKSSNAVAAHTQDLLCQENARNELIERDWFLNHFLTCTPFGTCEFSGLLPAEIQRTIIKLEKAGMHFEFAKANNNNSFGPIPVCCLIFGENFENPFGMFLGLGNCAELNKAAETALLESLRNVFAYMHEKLDSPLTINEFKNMKSHRPEDHRSLSLDLSYQKRVRELLFELKKPEPCNIRPFHDLIDSISYEKLPIPFSEIATVPLVFYRAFSEFHQDLYFGITNSENVNFGRLSSFADRQLIESDLFDLPHPIC